MFLSGSSLKCHTMEDELIGDGECVARAEKKDTKTPNGKLHLGAYYTNIDKNLDSLKFLCPL